MAPSDNKAREKPPPYGSAHDLPSVREMEQNLEEFKHLANLLPDQGSQLFELEKEVHRLANIVDHFYERLGPRNWIYHDWLNPNLVESILGETDEPEESEQHLIELYRDDETMKSWLMLIFNMDGLRERAHQIERALKHYFADEFDSCALQLIAVMDGFVNDFQPDLRKNLTAREPDEMAAWDNVVGHHMGLTHALKTFNKTIKKRVDDEVFELYRNGIVHGSIVRYDNVIVATKAWNMLFAVADWAKATLEFAKPKEPEPTLQEILEQVHINRRIDEKLDDWKASQFTLGDIGFEELEIYELTEQFLGAWRERNFGNLTRFENRLSAGGKYDQQLAGELREEFESFELVDFSITDIENCAPAISYARGRATVNGKHGSFECQWLLQDDHGIPAFGTKSSEWRLDSCSPTIWRASD